MNEQRYSSWVLERVAIGEAHRLRLGCNSVGRHSSSLIRILDSNYVSRHHAELEVSRDDQAVTIKDLNSVNGIFINNTLHKSTTITLSKGDHIGIGVSIDCSEEEDELTLPIYELKYLPITRGKQSAAATTSLQSSAVGKKIKNENDASSKPPIVEDILIISDDDDEDIKNVVGEKKKVEENQSNLCHPDIIIKKEKIESEQPKTSITEKEVRTDMEQCQTSKAGNSKEIPNENKSKEIEDMQEVNKKDTEPETLPENDKLHMPIISKLKKELIRSVCADVQDIFGDLDDDQKNKLKEINPLVYNDLNEKSFPARTNHSRHLFNGDCITLLSDDEASIEDEERVVNTNAKVSEESTPQVERTKSPNIFDISLNDSAEDGNVNALAVLKNHLNEKEAKEKQKAIDNVDLDDYTSYDPHSDDDDEYMFSQVLINNMKDELEDDFNKDALPVEMKQEPDLERNASLLNEIANSCWVISDDEDYDEELETKVSDWSTKIFSQSYCNNSLSQVYDLDDTNIESDDDDDVTEYNDHEDFNIVDDDIDNIADLYNSNNDILETSIDKEVQTITEKDHLHLETKKERSVQMTDIEGKSKEKDQEKLLDEVSTSSAKTPEKEANLDILQNIKSVTDVQEKSPEKPAAEKQQQSTDTESPLIRIKRKSTSKCNRINALHSSEDEFESDNKQEKTSIAAEEQTNASHPGKSITRPPPTIIKAPVLPKYRGKLRGVSAEKSSLPAVSRKIHQKLNAAREQIRHELIQKDLKRKWVEKPSIEKKRDKERMKAIKECRKDKLKELAEKRSSSDKDNLKRKISTTVDGENKAKKAKVKVTKHNRGAFLAENDTTTSEKPKDNKPTTKFKIPKITNKKPENVSKDRLQRCNSTDEIKKKEPPKRSASIDGGFSTFSQEISKPDQLLVKKPEPKSCTTHKRTSTSTSHQSSTAVSHADTAGTVCKEALAARALRTTNKITFASMEKNITESEKNKNMLNNICSDRCNNVPNASILSNSDRGGRKMKKVRFNDTPIIHYIERVCGARKVASKDILPLTTHKDRRHMIRRTFPIIDNTNKIISQILTWSDEWLIKRNAEAEAATDIVYPMSTHFSSFDHYKSIIFPLMKLEFVSLLERQYNLTTNIKKYDVMLEYVTVNHDRLMLVTKFNYQNQKQLDNGKYDLVILHSNELNKEMFAYLTSTRKWSGTTNTMVFEIVAANITKDFFINIKTLTVRPVLDNVRVEFGAFNAVYQLEATPLFQKVLNPLDLLQCRPPPKKKVIYRGFDTLNDKQRQVLLNTYVRIIDESTPNISLLQGPPGTGKSCVITNLALQTMYGDEVRCMDKKVLICAQSNAAVDVIAGKLYDISMRMRPERRFRLIRYGLQEKINPLVYPVTLQHIIEQEQLKKFKALNPKTSLENKENLKNQMLQLEAQIANMKQRNVTGTVEEDILLEKQRQLQLMRNISNQFTRPEDERSIVTWYLNNANIVCATLSSCVKLSQYVNYFDICIIDEATQCTEPWTLLPLKFGINSLVLVGDTQQLPATILSKKANELGLGNSMFTRIQNCLDNVMCGGTNNNTSISSTITPHYIISGLQTQYRMNPEICRWPNQYFYRNELINGRITMEYKTPLMPFSVLNLAYTQNDFCTNGKITNNLEAEFVAKLLKALDGFIPNKYNSYGVITPYAHHRTTLETAIRSLGLTNIMVNTIDSYQGLEKDVIVISNARTHGIGFLANPQRLNVALTRPKKCLLLCGNFKNLESVPAWRCLLQNARDRNVYHEISTNCVNDIQTNVIDKIRIKK